MSKERFRQRVNTFCEHTKGTGPRLQRRVDRAEASGNRMVLAAALERANKDSGRVFRRLASVSPPPPSLRSAWARYLRALREQRRVAAAFPQAVRDNDTAKIVRQARVADAATRRGKGALADLGLDAQCAE